MLQIDCPMFERFVQENPDVNINELLIAIVSFHKEFSKGNSGEFVLDKYIEHSKLIEDNRLMEMQKMMDKNHTDFIHAWRRVNETSMKESVEKIMNLLIQEDTPLSKPLNENTKAIDIINNTLKESEKKIDDMIRSMVDVNKYVLPYKVKNNKVAGTLKEEHFERLLNESLDSGYAIENISKGGHNCDLKVSYTGRDGNTSERCPILVEVKFWQTTNVDTGNVNRFLDDIRANNTHGIMVSLESNIANKHNMKFEVVPNTNLIALYLCKVGDDVEKIKQAMEVIYTLDDVMKAQGGVMPLTPKVVRNIIRMVEDNMKIVSDIETHNETAKKHIDESLRKFKKVRLTKIVEDLLSGLDSKEADKMSDITSDDESDENGSDAFRWKCVHCHKVLDGLSAACRSNHKLRDCGHTPEAVRKDRKSVCFEKVYGEEPTRSLQL